MIYVGVDVGLSSDYSALVTCQAMAGGGTLIVRAVQPVRPDLSTTTITDHVVANTSWLLRKRSVTVVVDGVGLGAPVAEQIRDRCRTMEGLAIDDGATDRLKVGVVLATGGRKANRLPNGPLDFRLSCPASMLLESVQTGLANGTIGLDPAADGLAELKNDLQSLVADPATGKITAPRTGNGHADTASALALAAHAWLTETALDPTSAAWAKARARESAIERITRNRR